MAGNLLRQGGAGLIVFVLANFSQLEAQRRDLMVLVFIGWLAVQYGIFIEVKRRH